MNEHAGESAAHGTKRLLLWLAVLVTVATGLLALGGMWWWALLGMTHEVGGAVVFTSFVLAIGAAVAWGAWSDA